MDAPPRPMTPRDAPKPHCSVDGCERKYNGKGYCAMHAMRLARHGDVHNPGRLRRSQTGLCTIEGCDGKHLAKGLCHLHYYRTVHERMDLAETLTCARCATDFPRPHKGNPRAIRFCSHECRYADQLDGHRADPDRRARIAAWRAKNPHQFRAYLMKRDGLKRAAESREVTGRDLQRTLARFGGMCAYCRTRKHKHWDHVVPLIKGGRHAIGNLLPSCASCNLAKGAKLLAEWRLLQPVPRRFRGRVARKTA